MIELLVVVTIIGILAALLLPALASVRRKAQAAFCVNNLRQIGHGTLGYCQDNDDRLPFAWINNPDASINNFHSLVQPQILRMPFDGYGDFERGVFLCPIRKSEALVGTNPFRVSYGMNGFNALVYGLAPTFRIEAVQSPSTTFLAGDVTYTWNTTSISDNTLTRMGFKHIKTANSLLIDGHVASYNLRSSEELIFKF